MSCSLFVHLMGREGLMYLWMAGCVLRGGAHKKAGRIPGFFMEESILWLGGRLSGRRRTGDFLSFDQAAGEIKSAFFLDRL